MSGRWGHQGRAPTGTGHMPVRHLQPSRQSTDTFCRLCVLLHIYQPDLHGPLHKPLGRSLRSVSLEDNLKYSSK